MAQDRRVVILEAACQVISRQGVHRLRMSDVAREAGVSNALVHYYFDTRAELLIRTFEHHDARETERTERQLELLPLASQRLERALLVELDDETATHQSWVLWSEMWNAAVFDPALKPPVRERYGRWLELLERLIDEGREDGSIPVTEHSTATDIAARLGALLDGFGEQIALGILDPVRARELLRVTLRLELELEMPTAEPSAL